MDPDGMAMAVKRDPLPLLSNPPNALADGSWKAGISRHLNLRRMEWVWATL